MNRWVLLGLVLVLLVFLAGLRSGGQAAPQAGAGQAKWEYQVLSESALTRAGGLNKMGTDGWELVAVEPKVPKLSGFNVNLTLLRIDKTTGIGNGSGMANGLTFTYEPSEKQYYFKRAK